MSCLQMQETWFSQVTRSWECAPTSWVIHTGMSPEIGKFGDTTARTLRVQVYTSCEWKCLCESKVMIVVLAPSFASKIPPNLH